ncbi:putative exporter [Roseomonas alkaliterrae]|uniref:Putative exporter n=3 Tax=Neoroseomonas alkaliterrae TaxID=1452450 RepID=A0A840Y2C2_9PROT|nr:MMPL family transporter [Neoroseomonas alkaliterrae]MBB5688792.1 putative exporter [Neoroseomonas alkaliterrae]
MRRHAPLLLALLLAAAAFALALRHVPLRADIADFLPAAQGEEAAFLLRELREGAGTRLLLAGIEGAPEAELARLSRAMAERLRESGLFAVVANGPPQPTDAEAALLFARRYALSPATTPEAFTEPALRAALEAVLDGLRSSAEPLVRRFAFADPTGAFPALLRGWAQEHRIALHDGVWMAEGPRALLLMETRAGGMDPEAQARAAEAARAAFAAAAPSGEARLLLSGPGVFAAAAAEAIRADVRLVSILSASLVAAFLLWRYRSLMLLGAVALPVLLGALAGLLAVQAAFGHVHGAAFGFGMTMLGVAADYPVVVVAHRAPGESVGEAARRVWPTLRLAVATSVAGLTPMLASGFPGLAQLGLFAGAGLLAAALAARLLLPALLPAEPPALRPLPRGAMDAVAALAARRRLVPWLLGGVAAALLLAGAPRLERDIAALSPVPEALRELDGRLRAQAGAPDVRLVLSVRAPDAEGALVAAERAAAALTAAGAAAAFDHPARWLPSAATQRARLDTLPDAATLAARLEAARAGLPFRPGAFAPFLEDVAAARAAGPLTPDALEGAPLLAARLATLLRPENGGWRALLLPEGAQDPAALRAAAAPGLLVVDIKAETERILDAGIATALRWGGLGAGLVLALLLAGRGRAGLRLALVPGGALLLAFAALHLLGERVSVFHLTAALLLAGVGMDYALFMSRMTQEDAAEDARALGAVVTCMVTTLLTFGLLALCRTPVLHAMGLTVSLGVAAAFLLACALAPPRRGRA